MGDDAFSYKDELDFFLRSKGLVHNYSLLKVTDPGYKDRAVEIYKGYVWACITFPFGSENKAQMKEQVPKFQDVIADGKDLCFSNQALVHLIDEQVITPLPPEKGKNTLVVRVQLFDNKKEMLCGERGRILCYSIARIIHEVLPQSKVTIKLSEIQVLAHCHLPYQRHPSDLEYLEPGGGASGDEERKKFSSLEIVLVLSFGK